MSTEPQRTCPNCGNEFSGAMEFCPVCMLRKGFAGGVESGESCFEEAVRPTPDKPPKRFEHYELVTGQDGKPVELGRGAMGVTYKAFDVDLHCPVTLKVISEKYLGDESARLRFLREARAAASVRHPNVASVFHLGRTGQNYFYAMEFVEGETLENLIKHSGRLAVKLALEIATQVAAGLAAVHKQKLVHRDIKPSNIMVSVEEGNTVTAKIIDLGLAKAANEPSSEAAISTPGAFAGTPEFASPEQFAGVSVDVRSDLYSLGITLWEMLTGQTPFRGTPTEVMHQHQLAPLPLQQLKDVPQSVTVLLGVLLQKDPTRRFQNPTELLKAMQRVTNELKARPINRKQKLLAPFVDKLGSRHKVNVRVRSIAVLPFESLSDNKTDSYFADGIHDEILSHLAKVSQLKVISRTSVMTYRPGGNRDLRSIASALGVAHVVEGTVQRDGGRVRLKSKLIDARTDEIVWCDSYDRDLTDIFAIQSEIAQTIVTKLSARLSPKERRDIESQPTHNLEAYDLYLQAKGLITNSLLFFMGGERRSLLDAIRLLEEATRKDSQFVLAYCLIARAHDDLHSWNFDNTAERRALGDAAVSEALRLRPDLPEVHLTAAYHLYICYRNYERARVQIAMAEQDLQNSPHALALAAYIDERQGNWKQSTKGLERAIRLDPRNPELLQSLAINYLYLRRYRDAEHLCDRLIQLNPDKPTFKLQKAAAEFFTTADLMSYRATLERLRPSMQDNMDLTYARLYAAVHARDWPAAKDILNNLSADDFPFPFYCVMVPRICIDLWITRLQGKHPTTEGRFSAARDQLKRKVEERQEDARLLSALALVDAALGRKQEAIEEGRRAVEMLPVSEDAWDGPGLVLYLIRVYSLTNEPELALENIAVSIKTPGGEYYCDLKLDPALDALRADPRFDQLVAQLVPRD
jgi:serine/threonine protein kinase/Flp pilus assembly protein TadD